MQPGRELRFGAVPTNGPRKLDADLLGYVLGLLALAGETVGEAVDAVVVVLQQLGKRLAIARGGALG